MKAMRRRIAVHRSDRRAASSGHIFGGDNDSRLFCLRRVSFELWQRWVHMVPRLRVRGEDVVARTKPTRVVQTSGVDSDNWRCAFGIFSSRYSRTTLSAKATFMLKPSRAWCEMVAQLTFRQPKRRCRHKQARDESAARHSLAIAAMAFEHHNGFSGTFVANRSANATACKWHDHNLMV